MTRLSALVVILALAFSSLVPATQVSSSTLPAASNVSEPLCGSPTTVRLLSEKNLDAGTVTVANGATTLFVTYTTKANYKLTVTQVAVANTLAAIPVTRKGNPIPGQFPYQTKHTNLTSFTYAIPRSGLGSSFYVAAHADVVKTAATKIEGAWGEGTAFVPGQRSWGMYFTAAMQSCNRPPVANAQTVTTDEEASVGITLTGSDPEGSVITFSLVTPPAHGTLNGGIPNYTYVPAPNFNGSDSFTFKTNDGLLNSAPATVTITVRPVNDPPAASDGSANTLEGASVAINLGALADDLETADANLIYMIDTGPGHGSLSGSGPSITYVPATDYFGPDSFTFHVKDRGDPDNCGVVGPACAAALASSTHLINITVDAVNDAPSFALPASPGQTVFEDAGAQSVAGFATGISAGPANEAGQMLTFHVSNSNNALFSAQPGLDPTTGDLTFTPAADANGSATVSVYLMDDGGTANGGADTSSPQTFLIQITPVNDAPGFTLPGSPDQTVLQDAGAQTVSSFATLISAGPADEAGQALTFHLSNNNNALFAVQPSINEVSGNLTYQSAPGVSGAATVSVYLMDNGGTANGGADTSATQSFLISIVPPNASPAAQAQTVSTDEDATLALTLTGTDADSPSLTFTIVDNPAHGVLDSLGAVNCGAGTCSVGVDYTPALNYNGADSFTFKVNDGLADSNTATVAITVDAVNDPPSFSKGADQTVLEDAGAQTVTGWATAISPGPANESGQIVAINATGNTNPGLFAAGPTVAANGDLTYTPAPNAFGSATITLVAQDDGGIANGGDNTSASQTFDITVTPVNDAPAFSKGADQTVNEDAGAQTVASWATGIAAGPNEGGQVVTFVIGTNDNPTLFSAGPAVASDGTLTFTPAANKNGVANITLYVQDNGGTANGGDDTSDPQSFVITVSAVNDAPLAIAHNYAAQANMQIVGLTGLLTGATDPDSADPGFTSQLQVGSVSATNPAGGTVSLTDAGAGTFSFDPPPGASGNVTFTYTVCDNGNPTPSACSAPAMVTVNVAGPVIWFVNAAVAGPGTGTLADPFKTVAAADAVDAVNQRIFLYAGTYANGITLNTGEWLIGQGVTGVDFDAIFGITPAAGTIARPSIGGTRPIVQGTVALAASASVHGLNIQPGAGTQGLTASSAASLTVGEVSVTTTNAAAVNLASSGGTISLTSVSVNGGSRGIILNGTTGTFAVTGTGGTCTEANPSGCTGGTIQNMTGSDDSTVTPVGTGVVLNNAAGVSLTRMYIHDHTNYGVRGTGVNGFTLDNSVVGGVNGTNAAAPYEDGSISFDNLSGTSAITNSAITGGYTRNVRVDNTTGTLTLTVNADSIHNTSNAAGDDGLLIEIGGGSATLNVTNNTFAAHGGDHFNLSLLGSPTVGLTFTGNSWSGGHPIGLGQGLFILGATFNGAFTYDILNNGTVANPLVGNNSGGALHVNKGSGTGTFSGTISNNVIGNPSANGSGSLNASGIDVEAHGAGGSHTTLISNNLVRQFHNDGILILAGEGNAAFNVTLTGNTVSDPDTTPASFHGVHFNIGTLATDALQACLDVRNNALTNGANELNAGVDLRMRQRQLTTVRLPGYGGANNDNAAVQAFLTGANGNAVTTITASNSVATGGGGYVGGAACPQP